MQKKRQKICICQKKAVLLPLICVRFEEKSIKLTK